MYTRFAPSPTGYLHLGHALSALLNHEIGRGFFLRMEDLDSIRSKPHFQEAIIWDLSWLECKIHGEVLSQKNRQIIYKPYLHHLIKCGWVYPCFCSRKESIKQQISPHIQKQRTHLQIDTPIYSGTCKHIPKKERNLRTTHEPYSWRLDADALQAHIPKLYFTDMRVGQVVSDLSLLGDVVLARVDKAGQLYISYHLACTIDDALQKIDVIIRGRDILPSTIVHRTLQYVFSFSTPLYFHHDLILDERKRKLSKRNHATSLARLRGDGWSSKDIRQCLEPILTQNIAFFENPPALKSVPSP